MAGLSPNMTLLTNCLQHFSCFSFFFFFFLSKNGVGFGQLESSLLWSLAVHHKWVLERARVQGSFLAEGKYLGLRSHKIKVHAPGWEESVCVCTKPTAVFCSRCFLRELPRRGLPAILPKVGQPERFFVVWKSAIENNSREHGKAPKRAPKPLGQLASSTSGLSLGRWISLAHASPSLHPHPRTWIFQIITQPTSPTGLGLNDPDKIQGCLEFSGGSADYRSGAVNTVAWVTAVEWVQSLA